MTSAPLPTLMVVPTGIGCAIGGYAGDALPSARLLAAASDCLITHPNVMNGAALYWRDPRIHYVEGYSLDRFAAAEWVLRPVRRQRIGLLLDVGIEPELAQRQIQVAEGCSATLGLEIGPVVQTEQPLEVQLELGASGASSGRLAAPGALLRAGERLKQAGATAVAVVARFPEDPDSEVLAAYRQGSGVDAPALAPLPLAPALDPRAAGEELGYTFLACVLVGLSCAPDLLPAAQAQPGDLLAQQLGAVVAPQGALGGEAVLACLERGVPLISVANPSLLAVDQAALGLERGVLQASSYSEAAGLLLALREGLAPAALTRPVSPLQRLP